MPNFIVPMAIRFFLVSLGSAVIVQLLVDQFASLSSKQSFFRNASLLLPLIIAGYWSGWFFHQRAGRASDWTEAWTSGAALALIFVATIWLSAAVYLTTHLEIGFGKRAWATGLLAGFFYSLFLYPVAWLGLSSMLHSGSKAFDVKT